MMGGNQVLALMAPHSVLGMQHRSACPPSWPKFAGEFKLETHEGTDTHGDVCRKADGSGQFRCPHCCTKVAGAPHCLSAASGPCRATVCHKALPIVGMANSMSASSPGAHVVPPSAWSGVATCTIISYYHGSGARWCEEHLWNSVEW